MKRHPVATRHDQTAIRGARESRDGALDLTGVAHIDRGYLHPERRRQGLDDAELGGTAWYGGIPKDRHTHHARRDLLEQFQPFPADAVFEIHETGDVATGAGQAVDEACTDRIGNNRKHDRYSAGQQAPPTPPRVYEFRRYWPWPSGYQSARCGHWSSLIAPAPAGTPRRGPEIPHRPQLRARARRYAACARPAAPASRVATPPPPRRRAP